jgi:hypothetical protein
LLGHGAALQVLPHAGQPRRGLPLAPEDPESGQGSVLGRGPQQLDELASLLVAAGDVFGWLVRVDAVGAALVTPAAYRASSVALSTLGTELQWQWRHSLDPSCLRPVELPIQMSDALFVESLVVKRENRKHRQGRREGTWKEERRRGSGTGGFTYTDFSAAAVVARQERSDAPLLAVSALGVCRRSGTHALPGGG